MHIVIIGNGIAGITCARYLRKQSQHKITIISGENLYFYSRPSLMYIYMGHMRLEDTYPYETHFWKKNKLELLENWVFNVDFDHKIIHFEDSTHVKYDMLVIASGSSSRKLNCPGENIKGVQGLYNLQDLNSLEELTSQIEESCVIGGGLIGVELAEMLHSRGKKVRFLIRESSFYDELLPQEESKMVQEHIQYRGIDIINNVEVISFQADKDQQLIGVMTSHGESIPCQFAGVCIGVEPNISFLKNSNLEFAKGILVNSHFQTNIPDVYAIGDCAELESPQIGRKSIEPIWYTAKHQGKTAAFNIGGTSVAYHPPIWYNSAKFFDLEYQTYGFVPSQIEQYPELETYSHSSKSDEKLFRLVWQKESRVLVGVNALGIRINHECVHQWLSVEKTVDEVLKVLHEADFNIEFSKDFFKIFKNHFNSVYA